MIMMEEAGNFDSYRILLWKKGEAVTQLVQHHLSFEFLQEDYDYVLYLKFPYAKVLDLLNLAQIKKSLEEIPYFDQYTFTVLTLRWEPSTIHSSIQEKVYSFFSPYHTFKNMLLTMEFSALNITSLLFLMLDHILGGNTGFNKLLVRQIPIKKEVRSATIDCDVVIPHRGVTEYLKSVLFFLNSLDHLHVYVGIDQDLDFELLKIKSSFTNPWFYHFKPSPVGPYVIRNHLIKESENEIIFFQDSDDIPCADRFSQLSNYMNRTGCQLCGSHELRVDYLDQTVKAVRFPRDVKKALESKPNGHQLFHPASAITRNAFQLCDDFSADRTFGYDTQFLLRSFFLLDRVMNVDEFLYIRRLHADSLTTAPGTRMKSPLRQFSLMLWYHDFRLVQKGKLQLKDSTLKYRRPIIDYTAIRL